ncbi:ABC transporter substrate-binding protein [Pseudochelatococcus lubricantis]|uniref:ABC transporter substrate-binding protein n=1 Tax=Pseudochelatococcus lubricantis TaxID=1538102 RepID=UPI0035EAFF61
MAGKKMKRLMLSFAVAAAVSTGASAQDPIKIGFISTFSGPSGQLGHELLDGFNLGLKSVGGKLAGRPVDVIQGDDQAKPDIGRQLADRMIERDGAQLITGINFSNVMLAIAKPVLDAGAFIVSVNAGPSQYAGKLCHPRFFVASFQTDTASETMGIYLQKQGVQRVYLMAPNYPAGRDMLTGFKRYFKGEIAGEVYTTFGQLDYAAEIAQLRAARPDAVFFFYPGGMGINFVKQYAQAGLAQQIPLYAPSFSLDQTVLPGIGDAAIGAFASTFWPEDFDNPASKKFRDDFEAAYGRIPSPNAANAYDTVRMLDAALKTIDGKIEDKPAFQKALGAVSFESIRGNFRFGANNMPIIDYYLAEVAKDGKGRALLSKRDLIVSSHTDSYSQDCDMKAAGN